MPGELLYYIVLYTCMRSCLYIVCGVWKRLVEDGITQNTAVLI